MANAGRDRSTQAAAMFLGFGNAQIEVCDFRHAGGEHVFGRVEWDQIVMVIAKNSDERLGADLRTGLCQYPIQRAERRAPLRRLSCTLPYLADELTDGCRAPHPG